MMYLLLALAFVAVFYGGICFGISDCKRRYGIAKGVTPDQFNANIADLEYMAYGVYQEVEV